jgi:lysophospholipase L1-like esterase
MKHHHLILLFLITASSIQARYPRASYWDPVIKNFALQDSLTNIHQQDVVFIGSSSISNWYSLSYDFPESKVLNRGMSGCWITDMIYFLPQIVFKYNPKQVVIYSGDNDMMIEGKTPDDFMEELITLVRLIRIHLPETKLVLMAVKPSPARRIAFDKYRSVNHMMKEYAEKYTMIDFADTWTPMLSRDGNIDVNCFSSDNLHLSAMGYARWKETVAPFIMKSSASVDQQTGIGNAAKISLYPGDSMHVFYESNCLIVRNYQGWAEIYHLSGQKLFTGVVTQTRFPVMLSKGIYLVRTSKGVYRFTVSDVRK